MQLTLELLECKESSAVFTLQKYELYAWWNDLVLRYLVHTLLFVLSFNNWPTVSIVRRVVIVPPTYLICTMYMESYEIICICFSDQILFSSCQNSLFRQLHIPTSCSSSLSSYDILKFKVANCENSPNQKIF